MLNRSARIDQRAAKKESSGDLVIDMAFASEEPYERWWGIEILDHSEGSIRLERLNDGASLLFNHNPNDLRGVHVPGTVRIDKDKVLRGSVRITSATAAGRDAIALVESGVLSKTSVGYRVHRIIQQSKTKAGEPVERELDGRQFEALVERGEKERFDRASFTRALDEAFPVSGDFPTVALRASDEPDVFRVIDWEPYEDSLVTIPADPTVGVGRSAVVSFPAVPATTKEATMPDGTNAPAGATAENTATQPPAGTGARVGDNGPSAVDLERARRRGIENLCRANKIDDKIKDHWIATGLSLDQVADDLLRIMEERGRLNPESPAKLGLSPAETNRFSLSRALLAVMDKDWTNAGYELECSRAIAQRLNKPVNPTTFFVPFEVQQRQIVKRDLTVASGSGGGYLVSTENVGFIELLRNRSVAFNMGAIRLSGLQGSVTVPKQTAGASAYWLTTESTQITEGSLTFGQMALSPKTVGAYVEVSRQLLLQSSPDVEVILTSDLASQVGLAADLAVLNGSGASGQPTGIIGTSGVGSTTATSVDYGKILDFQADLAAANVMPVAGGYVTTSAVAKILMTKQRFSNTDTPLWDGTMWDGRMAGFRAMSSEQMPSGYMIFGDWSKVVVGEWGVLEVTTNPYANFQAGIIGVRAMYSLDVGVRYPAAFSVSTSVTA